MNNVDRYVQFVDERFKVYQRRQIGLPPPWTDDEDIRALRFTNVYRILDPGSQFVVKELLYSDQPSLETAVLRTLLYRFNNRPEPWVWFRQEYGAYPTYDQLGDLLELWKPYPGKWFNVFAYKVYISATTLISSAQELLPTLVGNMHPGMSVEALTVELRWYARISDFLSMQIATDLGLSPHYQNDEDSFVILGPGAVRGAKLAFGDSPTPLQDAREALGDRVLLEVAPGVIRRPSYMDIQNTFCEFNKLMYWSLMIKAPARPKQNLAPLPEPFFPPHWKQP